MLSRMALVSGISILVASVAACCAEAPFSITISMTPVAKAGAEVRLSIVYTNTSEQEIELVRNTGPGGEFFNRVLVQDERGRPAPLTKYGRDLTAAEVTGPSRHNYLPRDFSGGLLFLRMPPGKTREDAIILSKLHDLSRPGIYTVQVERFDEMTKTFVSSNRLTITVTE
jgi:hypothetical protein